MRTNMIHPLMNECHWAQNRSKLQRAIKEVRGDNDVTQTIGTNEVTEEAVLVVYRRLLGFVIEGQTPEARAKRTKGDEDGDGLDNMKVAELRALAEERGVEHDGLKKDELIEKLRA